MKLWNNYTRMIGRDLIKKSSLDINDSSYPNANCYSKGNCTSWRYRCWTNCEDWGLTYGEYHFHNEGPASSHVTEGDTTAPLKPVETHTYDEGYNEAYSYWYKIVYEDLKKKTIDKWNAQWTEYNEDYSNGYRDGFNKAVEDASNDFKEFVYNRGFEDGESDIQKYGQRQLDATELWERSKTEPDYIRGYSAGSLKDDESVPVHSSEDKSLFSYGYDEGYEAAANDYIYDDFDWGPFLIELTKQVCGRALVVHKAGGISFE